MRHPHHDCSLQFWSQNSEDLEEEERKRVIRNRVVLGRETWMTILQAVSTEVEILYTLTNIMEEVTK